MLDKFENNVAAARNGSLFFNDLQLPQIKMTSALNNLIEKTEIYDDGFLHVEHENYYVACGGKNVRLPRSEFLIFSRLVRTPLRFVSAEELWQAAWSNHKKFNSVSLHVYVYRLRRKFEPFGLMIETMVNVGYRFMPLETVYKPTK